MEPASFPQAAKPASFRAGRRRAAKPMLAAKRHLQALVFPRAWCGFLFVLFR